MSALERGQQRGDMTKQNTLDFMERKTENVPSLDQYAGLALAAGQSGMGVGGGGVVGGGEEAATEALFAMGDRSTCRTTAVHAGPDG